MQWRQSTLFDDSSLKHRDAVAKLIDSLSARLGRDQVVTPTIVRDPLPEQQVRMRPLTGLRVDGRAQETKRKLPRAPKRNFATEQSIETGADEFLSRPSALVSTPIPIGVDVAATGEPMVLRWKNGDSPILGAAGPERIESGWWSGPSQRREYYRVLLAAGDWWWIFRDLQDGQWYLHGAFA
jgi:protein ImuB